MNTWHWIGMCQISILVHTNFHGTIKSGRSQAEGDCYPLAGMVDCLPERFVEIGQGWQDYVGDGQALVGGDGWIGHADAGHFGRFGCQQAEDGIFEDEALAAGDAQFFGRADVDGRMGFAVPLIFGRTDDVEKAFNTQGADIGVDDPVG